MTTGFISNLGIKLFTVGSLQSQQVVLSKLNQQLASNQKHNNLTDYTPLEAQNIMNFQNAITQRQSYVAAMKTVSARLEIYDDTMTDLENLASQARQLAVQNPLQDTNRTGIIQQQILAFINQGVVDLNQKVGSRYIYSGTRYTTVPVDLNTVLTTGVPGALVTSPTLPPYDTDAPGNSTSAWTNDTVTIDTGYDLQYGATSTQTGFQQLIAGMQYIYAASQTGVSAANYATYMDQAATLLSSALTNIQTYHAGVAAAINTVKQQQDTLNGDISSLEQQIGDIKSVDLTKVGTELNLLQTQLQASYSAAATLTQQTILKYL
ncbi:MAG: flagellin [Bdellovibrionales bacterium]